MILKGSNFTVSPQVVGAPFMSACPRCRLSARTDDVRQGTLRRPQHPSDMRRILSCIARASPNEEIEGSTVTSGDESKDFWEGETWEAVGKIAYFALPALIALGVAVGLFAANTYNEGATVFLESAKSDSDSAQLYSAR